MPYQPKRDKHNGLLHFKATQPLAGYWRYFPSPDLAPYVEHYWTVEWDLPEPQLRETLPYPSAHIILEPGAALLGGVNTAKFSRVLEGRSRVLGVKFRPGGLRPFVAQAVSAFTDRVLPLRDVFGAAAEALDQRVLAHADHHAAIAVVESFLRGLNPCPDAAVALAASIVGRIAQDRQIRQVEQIVHAFNISTRKLQRLFSDYVGVSPKWTIQRYRLQEAAERMAAARTLEWATIAIELGYADQAHFIRDFKKVIGRSPADYFKALAPTTSGATVNADPGRQR
ncbi:MAG: helix-turn-helix domain-containing protein [Rudaea sp.]|nr:helix-turn-helix domain-containing protein [Rudaea sp.]